jgi:PKD repeat protein
MTPVPGAQFTANITQGTSPLTVQFTDQSVSTGTTSYKWDINNDGVVDYTAKNPVHTYTAAGTYTVKLTVTNASGSDSETRSAYIRVSAPVQTGDGETFGALSNPTGNPIGGGTGYSRIITSADPGITYRVTTAAALKTALNSATSGSIIYISESADIDVSGMFDITIPAGVTLAGNRGENGSPGGILRKVRLPSDPSEQIDRSKQAMLYIAGNNVRITGLRLIGGDLTSAELQEKDLRYAITITNWKGLEVDNNEIYGWSGAGVLQDTWKDGITTGGLSSAEIGSGIVYVHHNSIHHCQTNGRGYGVAVYRNGAALIKGNLFDYTRHAVCSDGWPNSGYEASYNVHLGHSTDHVFDVHGYSYAGGVIAGTLVKVHHNTVYAPVPSSVPWSVAVRGVPQQQVSVTFNDFPYTTYWGNLQAAAHDSPVTQYDFGGMGNVIVTKNLIAGAYSADGPIKRCHQTSIGDFTCGYS